jgi:hypothetical protein
MIVIFPGTGTESEYNVVNDYVKSLNKDANIIIFSAISYAYL